MASASVNAHRSRAAEIRTRQRALNDQHRDGDLGTDADEYGKLDAELTTREAAVERELRQEDAERRATATSVHSGNEETSGSFSILDTVRAQMGMTDEGARRAREHSEAISQRTGRTPEG